MAASRWITSACMRSACAAPSRLGWSLGAVRTTCPSAASIRESAAACPSGHIGGAVASSERLLPSRASWQYQAGQRAVDPDSLLRFAR